MLASLAGFEVLSVGVMGLLCQKFGHSLGLSFSVVSRAQGLRSPKPKIPKAPEL